MNIYARFTILSCLLLFGFQSVTAQVWKNSESKQSINREANVKKRLINNENALNLTKDATNQTFYNERIALLKSAESDITSWNAKIEAGDKTNSQRYNLLTNLKLSKVDAIQALINIRTAEVLYEKFGGDFQEEPLGILQELRGKIDACLSSFDEAISKTESNIQ